ncbi:helix-turn-helix domain-containing protein [Gilliamella sp. B2911]|uniref:helix-turn-helix domain-containing protein n=1 Tax=Gilliamella sp. B2911 TaxID=2817980 RepID=UPI00226ADA3C|nr:helix-turn-helix transcriptional regulator [Gilliamella sp. B2911]MCX8663587.1 helix-turn-helix transcriptional regulator [Gilliamella sp. B2911]
MTELTNIQFINNEQGQPQFVVLPYNQYLELSKSKTIDIESGVPSDVVNMVFDNNYSPAQAWREYLNLSQVEVANRIGISQSAYSQYEKSQKLRKTTRIKIAEALHVKPELLDF